jgi:hypothetical protein
MSHDKPADQPPQQQEQLSGSVVPPPAPVPPPSDAGQSNDTELRAKNSDKHDHGGGGFHLPGWLVVTLVAVGSPLLLVALVIGAILGAKELRRRRRRNAPRASARVAGAWRELIDHARDLGHRLPVDGATRREQAGLFGVPAGHELARDADALVFGPVPPADEEAAAYWQAVDEERARLSRGVGWWPRFKAAVNLVTFRQRWAGEAAPARERVRSG